MLLFAGCCFNQHQKNIQLEIMFSWNRMEQKKIIHKHSSKHYCQTIIFLHLLMNNQFIIAYYFLRLVFFTSRTYESYEQRITNFHTYCLLYNWRIFFFAVKSFKISTNHRKSFVAYALLNICTYSLFEQIYCIKVDNRKM